MNEQAFIKLIQYYRHDLVNHLQVISGYLSMNKKQKANEKLQEVITNFSKEQKLFQLQAPKLMIWLLQFNHTYENIRITYDIDMEIMDLSSVDALLVQACNSWAHLFHTFSLSDVLYDVLFRISSGPQHIMLTFTFQNNVKNKEQFMNDLGSSKFKIQVNEDVDKITCSYYVSY